MKRSEKVRFIVRLNASGMAELLAQDVADNMGAWIQPTELVAIVSLYTGLYP